MRDTWCRESQRFVCDGFERISVHIESDTGEISAFLLRPLGDGPFPAVVVHHQHASQWHLGKSEVAGLAGDPLQAFGPALAARGVIVLCADVIGFEDRRADAKGIEPHPNDWLQHYNSCAHRLVHGDLLMLDGRDDRAVARRG